MFNTISFVLSLAFICVALLVFVDILEKSANDTSPKQDKEGLAIAKGCIVFLPVLAALVTVSFWLVASSVIAVILKVILTAASKAKPNFMKAN